MSLDSHSTADNPHNSPYILPSVEKNDCIPYSRPGRGDTRRNKMQGQGLAVTRIVPKRVFCTAISDYVRSVERKQRLCQIMPNKQKD